MSAEMKNLIIFCILASSLVLILAEPEPEPEPVRTKFRSTPVEKDNYFIEARQAAEIAAANEGESDEDGNKDSKGDSSSGRLFLKKFLLFRNIFGNTNTQPVIPIIITGAGTGTATTNPTTTITSTGTIPTATGTITTAPATSRSGEDDAQEDETPVINEQALQAALVAGAEEYVVTDEEIKGTSDGKASKQSNRINLRRKGSKKGQVISVRIPPRYRQYFSNGQKVMLNSNNRPSKRRVVKKRGQNNRRRVNKRRRIVPIA